MNAPPGLRLHQLTAISRSCVRHFNSNRKPRPSQGFKGPEGHGEQVWVFSHRRSDQVIYSFSKVLDGFHSLKQLPFNGKKTKPAKLRKDYWSPMAVIEFPTGRGAVGRSVYAKLRELKHLHEVAWPDEFRYKKPEEFTDKERKEFEKNPAARPIRSKAERGVALNAQKQNAIADMAVVLAGQGRGNEMQLSQESEGEGELLDVSVRWSNDLDKEYANSWSENVTHGLLDSPAYVAGLDDVEGAAA